MSIPKRFTVYSDMRHPRKPKRPGVLSAFAGFAVFAFSVLWMVAWLNEVVSDAFDPEWALRAQYDPTLGAVTTASAELGLLIGATVVLLAFALWFGIPDWLERRSFEKYCRERAAAYRTESDFWGDAPDGSQ